MGHWSREAITQSYLPCFKAAGLLAAAYWPGTANNEFASAFWHERFLIEVPEELLLLVLFWSQSAGDKGAWLLAAALQLVILTCCSCTLCIHVCIRSGQTEYYGCIVLRAACCCLKQLVLPAGEGTGDRCRPVHGGFLARCVIQDAADSLASLYPDHAVHQLLLSSEAIV